MLLMITLGTWLAGGALGALIGWYWAGFEGGVIGFGAGLVFRGLFIRGMLWFEDTWRRKGPEFPPCVNGVCADREYMVAHGGPTGVLYTCRCGGEYVLESAGLFRGSRFDRVLEGSVLQPYWSRRPFSYWRPVESDQKS
jgi:hypothetical protein